MFPYIPQVEEHCLPGLAPLQGAKHGWSSPGMAVGKSGWPQAFEFGVGSARSLPRCASHPSATCSWLSAEAHQICRLRQLVYQAQQKIWENKATWFWSHLSVQMYHDPFDPRELAGASLWLVCWCGSRSEPKPDGCPDIRQRTICTK